MGNTQISSVYIKNCQEYILNLIKSANVTISETTLSQHITDSLINGTFTEELLNELLDYYM